MTTKWVAKLFLFFQPEDSCGRMDEKYFPIHARVVVIKEPNVSIKALFWLLISVLTGLAIGQLC